MPIFGTCCYFEGRFWWRCTNTRLMMLEVGGNDEVRHSLGRASGHFRKTREKERQGLYEDHITCLSQHKSHRT